MAIIYLQGPSSRGSAPDPSSELSRDPVVLKGEYLGRLGLISPVISQILREPNPYKEALRKARLYKASAFSMPTGTGSEDLSNYADADYYSSEFGRFA
jgi:hypothetical protein